MAAWTDIANVIAWVAYVPTVPLVIGLYPTMFAQMLFSDVETWPKNGWEWYENCVAAGFGLTMIPFCLTFGHGFLYRLLSFRFPFADGSFSFVNFATYGTALVLAIAVAVLARRKYEQGSMGFAVLCRPLFAIFVAWFNFGSSVFA